ncbi:hypothetical protein XENTR_v10017043 [Xenopus tropicalis]|nr:hypothetical protein XENTR_v10017043 [Xenopus tropicalis]
MTTRDNRNSLPNGCKIVSLLVYLRQVTTCSQSCGNFGCKRTICQILSANCELHLVKKASNTMFRIATFDCNQGIGQSEWKYICGNPFSLALLIGLFFFFIHSIGLIQVWDLLSRMFGT